MKKLVIANWKMQMTVRQSAKAAKIFARRKWPAGVDVAIAPSYLAIYAVREALRGSSIQLAAQDAYSEDKGTFTGEVSPRDLKEVGVKYVIIGHSERRRFFGETNEMIAKKIEGVVRNGMIPILCVGETAQERKLGKTWEVISEQLTVGLPGTFPKRGLVVAYEPVWAISDGRVGNPARPSDAAEVHGDVAALLKKRFGKASDACRILYGGSADANNAASFIVEKHVDGFLVGGASLKADSFEGIVDVCSL